MRNLSLSLTSALVAFALGCGSPEPVDENNTDNNVNTDGKGDQTGDVTMCAAIRGNGQLIPAHFGALARIVEHYGPVHAVSGGSSGSITSFFLASMQANPLTLDCGGESCSDAQRRDRTALLLKSFQGYIDYLATSDEALAVRAAVPIVQQVQEQGVEQTLASDPEAARAALEGILEQEDLVRLVNPELLGLVQNSTNPAFHVQDIVNALKGFGAFSADDPKILVRPGVLSFQELANRLDVAASFYAGYGPFQSEAVEAWMDSCAEPGRGSSWSAIRALPHGDSTCGATFVGLMAQYHQSFAADGALTTRLDDPVGYFMPALISTSVLTGDAIGAWQSARDQYFGGAEPELAVNFADVRFGYFGGPDALAALDEKTTKRSDLKSSMAIGLGTPTWGEVLALSPAEPGLARALEIDAEHVSAGGWSDLHPVLVLEDLGCDKVIYVTRTDPESNFAKGVAGLLGMTPTDEAALYDLADPNSSFSQSLAAADAVWCTNWNDIEASNIEGVVTDAYNAVLQSTDPFFTEGADAYANVTADTGLTGCAVPRGSGGE